MAFTTHPNQLDTKRGLRAGLIGLGVVALAGVAALGFSVVADDSHPAPAAVDYPTNDEMRAENMEIRHQIAAAAAAAEAPAAADIPTNDQMRAENQIIRDQVGAGAGATAVAGDGPTERDVAYAEEWARRTEIMKQQEAEAAAAASALASTPSVPEAWSPEGRASYSPSVPEAWSPEGRSR